AFHAGARAAADIVIALNERELSGRGQHLDTSMQEAIVYTLMASAGFPANTGADPPGTADDRAKAAIPARGLLLGRCPCADGYVIVTATSNAQLIKTLPKTVFPALRERGPLAPTLEQEDWVGIAEKVRLGEAPAELLEPAV